MWYLHFDKREICKTQIEKKNGKVKGWGVAGMKDVEENKELQEKPE